MSRSWLQVLLFLSLSVLALSGLLSPKNYNFLPAPQIAEVLLLSLVFMLPWRMKRSILILSACVVCYITYFMFYAMAFSGVYFLDVLLAIKAFFYLLIIGLAHNSQLISLDKLRRFFVFLLVVFLLKYGYSVSLGLSGRPGVFTENNFELMLIFLLATGIIGLSGKLTWIELLLITIIVLLSGSRSAALSLLVLFLLVFLNSRERSNLPIQFFVAPILLFLLSTAIVFLSLHLRPLDNLESIDRFRFMQLFVNDMGQSGWWRWAFGSAPLTALSKYSCVELSYYQSLFSYSGDGSCYSVIYHSMILRTIFDHGVLGLFFIISSIWYLLFRSGFSATLCFGVSLILLINGLSVSSFNSVFSALPIAMLLMVRRKAASHSRSHASC